MKFQKYVNNALPPVVKQAKSTKLAKKFCIESVTEFFDMVADFDVKVAEFNIKSLKKCTHVVGLEVTE
jgi:hypothetical protein